jgi:hypothetical protein
MGRFGLLPSMRISVTQLPNMTTSRLRVRGVHRASAIADGPVRQDPFEGRILSAPPSTQSVI